MQSIVLPDKSYYGFLYDAANPNNTTAIAYGDIAKIILPTGGSIENAHQNIAGSPGDILGNVYYLLRYVVQRDVLDAQGHDYKWSYV